MCEESLGTGENEANSERCGEEEQRVQMACQSMDLISSLEAFSEPGLSALPCFHERPQYLLNQLLLFAYTSSNWGSVICN